MSTAGDAEDRARRVRRVIDVALARAAGSIIQRMIDGQWINVDRCEAISWKFEYRIVGHDK